MVGELRLSPIAPVYAPEPALVMQHRAQGTQMPFSGGSLLAQALQRRGVRHLFTLSGGHLFPLYDGCAAAGLRVVDTRHEQSAVHAAEGWSKVTRTPGVAAVTAGPGVTNAATGLAAAYHNGSPLLVIGGRAPDARWGQGSLQEMDHIPLTRSIAKRSATLHDATRLHLDLLEALRLTSQGRPGPVFLDVPMDTIFSPIDETTVAWPDDEDESLAAPDPDLIRAAIRLIDQATRPVVLAGSGVYWHHGEEALRALIETAGLPLYVNGLGRGLVPSDHPYAFARTRGYALAQADLVLVLGTPLDFRLNFGQPPLFADDLKVIRVDYEAADLSRNRQPQVGLAGHIGDILRALANGVAGTTKRAEWLETLRQREMASLAREQPFLESNADPIHPLRIFGELLRFLDRDAIVIGDGGDFVSYAGRVMPCYRPGHWLDPGPFGALGMGPGYAMAARLAHPDKEILLLLGDGACGFAAMEFDTMVRHRLPVVAVVGNNAAWGLEKHPMAALYGYTLAAELNPAARYDQVVAALGGYGELVTHPDDIGPAIRRAFDSGLPALVNIMCDPSVAYPRQTSVV